VIRNHGYMETEYCKPLKFLRPLLRDAKIKFADINIINPLTPTVAKGTAIKHHVPDRVKPSFVIFEIRAL